MTMKKKFVLSVLLATMLLMNIAFVPVSAQTETSSVSSDVKQVTLTLDQQPGDLYIPTECKTIIDLSKTKVDKKISDSSIIRYY